MISDLHSTYLQVKPETYVDLPIKFHFRVNK